MTRAVDTLEEAKRIITGVRRKSHGTPERSFETIAMMWSAYLGVKVSPENAAWMMVLLKASRAAHGADPDHALDAVGYAALASELSDTKREEKQDVAPDFRYSRGAYETAVNGGAK